MSDPLKKPTLAASAKTVTLTDDATGPDNAKSSDSGAGIGRRNTRDRLRRLYGAAAGLFISSGASGGTLVRIVIPRSTAAA